MNILKIVFNTILSTIVNGLPDCGMGQNTRSQGVSFTNAMWGEIEKRCRELKCGRSQYFQMMAEADLLARPEIHAHKSDGKWHFYPEPKGRDKK